MSENEYPPDLLDPPYTDDPELARIKMLPQSMEAERSVLGGVLLSDDAWDSVAELVGFADFYRPNHRLIYRHMAKLAETNQPIDPVTVAEALNASGELDSAGGFAYLAELARDTPSASNIRAYATVVRDRSALRHLIQAAQDIADSGYSPEGRSSDVLIDEAERKIMQITEQGPKKGGPVDVNPLLNKAVDRIDELYNSGGEITGLSTGYSELDGMTSGLQRSDLVIVAGRPSMGKCIVSGSRIIDPATGALRPIDDLALRSDVEVVSLDGNFRLRSSPCAAFVDDGIKPVYRVTTESGREIEVTEVHPFLTGDGWKSLAALQEGEAIAIPRELPFFGDEQCPDYEVVAMAREASGARPAPPGVKASGDGAVASQPGACAAQDASNGIIPDAAFRLPRPQIALFLNHLLASAGEVLLDPAACRVVISLAGAQLAGQVQHLLLRLGIVARGVRARMRAQGRSSRSPGGMGCCASGARSVSTAGKLA
jgi:replicative DNA helicase